MTRRMGLTWAEAGMRRPASLLLSMYFARMARKGQQPVSAGQYRDRHRGKCAIVAGAAADIANENRGRLRGCTGGGGIR
jgi:hypothetical protein